VSLDRARASNTDSISSRAAPSRYDEEVSLAQIQYFVAVAEEENVGRAAKRLRIAQPPVSRHIRALEDELGTVLFERTPKGMRLLPAGATFLEHARGILAALDRAREAVRR
jgi:DNA-binding transcriptional LysR family regulator